MQRTELLIGHQGVVKLAKTRVMVVGLGGVGGFAAEAIARAGVGQMTLVDHDTVAESNLNRQLLALRSTLGRSKVEVMAERLRDINPELELSVQDLFIRPENIVELLQGSKTNVVIDCIDSIHCKADLVWQCQQQGIAVFSAMGAGGRLDASKVKLSTLAETDVCPLAREMRRRLRRLGADLNYPVVFSDELPKKGSEHQPVEGGRARSVNGTVSFLPAMLGLMLASAVVNRVLD
ncbi:MAG: tRNA threonylcarbamoyladenosine dehydratase [Gammaproteobacteria bacterium]|nr:tRNA threonylcarbamoyladenosine dehydratase [Gammaproteobacteria bacterium]